MKVLLGDSYAAFAAGYENAPVRALRPNSLFGKNVIDGALPFSVSAMPYGDGYYFDADSEDRPGKTALHHAGAFYIQEPSAMAPVASLKIKKDAKILDICASPGGKSIQAAIQATDGVLVSNEIVSSRAATLMGNIERMGIRNAIVTNTDSKTLASWYRAAFDLVICDAPCSGEGMFRKNPLAVSEWSVENVKMCAARQKEILDNAAVTVAENGYLLYSTCTFSIDENEMRVDEFLTDHPEFELTDVLPEVRDNTADGFAFDRCKHPEIVKCRRFYPHVSRGEGQFMALMRRKDAAEPEILYRDSAQPLSKNDRKTVDGFLGENLVGVSEGRIVSVGKYICVAPDFPIPPYSVFSAGVKVGNIEKGRVVPHHQLFSALGRDFRRTVDIGDDDRLAAKYLAGETFAADVPDGWTAVTVHGVPLGGAKAVSGVIKNHYPKGLRTR